MGSNNRNGNDTDLLSRFQSGEEEAFIKLYNEFKVPILNYIYRSCQDRSLAEDLTQEVFLKVFKGAKNYQPQGKISSWIYKISSHVLWKRMKKERRILKVVTHESSNDQYKNLVDSAKDTDTPDPLERVEKEEGKAAVRRAIETLPLKQRQAVILSIYEQLSYKEIGMILGMSEGAVKVMIHRAKKTLKNRLGVFYSERNL